MASQLVCDQDTTRIQIVILHFSPMLYFWVWSFIYSVHQILGKYRALTNRDSRLILALEKDVPSLEFTSIPIEDFRAFIYYRNDLFCLFLILLVNFIFQIFWDWRFLLFESVPHNFSWAWSSNVIEELLSSRLLFWVVLSVRVAISSILWIHPAILGRTTSVLPRHEIVLWGEVLCWQQVHSFCQFLFELPMESTKRIP